ncbi:hypothetical protein [Roseobacter weihaiensis]|uniref:hypothetical protein n=1 Tax=Roseobacter weihaiensis TaxID=2763262 RepID=UPI001D0A5CAF|nr:hypothetical protein [Roseobacter sp. H9]
MFIVCPSTLYNHKALETRSVPKRMIGRISLIPRREATGRMVARLIFEVQVLRFLGALMPFVVAMLIWPDLALPISQAPIPMLILIAFVETRVFNMPKEKREALVTEDEMARTLDALRFNGTRVLTRIAARRGMAAGELHLVVEQSELARVTPLTLVSVQKPAPDPAVLDLDPQARQWLREALFDETLTEKALHAVTLRQATSIHMVTLETGTISAHARMAALRETPPTPRPGNEVTS